MKIYENIVIGSGPSGTACAKALLDHKKSVLILDIGKKLDQDIEDKIDKLTNLKSANLKKYIIKNQKNNNQFPKKSLFNSFFCYKDFENDKIKDNKVSNLHYSQSLGGFSNVWGANCLPFLAKDISDWPITTNHLDQYYQIIEDLLDIKVEKDDLKETFPLYNPSKISNLSLRSKGEISLYNYLIKNKSYKKNQNIKLGYSRLAIDSNCKQCSLCMFGCPYNYIYNSKKTLNLLKNNNNFEYIYNLELKSFVEKNEFIELSLKSLNGQIIIFRCKKLFLGAGVLSTLKIIINSMKPDKEFKIKENQMIGLPIFAFKNFIDDNDRNTLSSLFLELGLSELNKRTMHWQIYLYDYYIQLQFKKIFPFNLLNDAIREKILKKFIFASGYLHSDYSPQISMRPLYQDNQINYKIDYHKNNETKVKISKALQEMKFFNSSYMFYWKKLYRMYSFSLSNHLGASLPMKSQPKYLETYSNGLLCGTKNVFIIDSSNFTSIPANTITFSLMANSYRIGKESCDK